MQHYTILAARAVRAGPGVEQGGGTTAVSMSMFAVLWGPIRTNRPHGTRSTAVEVVGEDAPRSPGGHRANVWRRIRPLDPTCRVPARRVGDRARPDRAGQSAMDRPAG